MSAKPDPHAEPAGVGLILENHDMSPMPIVRQMVDFLDTFRSNQLGIAYDVGNGEFVGEIQADAIQTAGQWLRWMHLSDASRTKRDHAPTGQSAIDFSMVGRALRQVSFAGTSIVELISNTPDTDRYGTHTKCISSTWLALIFRPMQIHRRSSGAAIAFPTAHCVFMH